MGAVQRACCIALINQIPFEEYPLAMILYFPLCFLVCKCPTVSGHKLRAPYSQLISSTDDALRNQMNPGNIEALGTIRLTFRRAKELGISTRTDSARYERPEEFGRVHERTKKAGAHCVS